MIYKLTNKNEVMADYGYKYLDTHVTPSLNSFFYFADADTLVNGLTEYEGKQLFMINDVADQNRMLIMEYVGEKNNTINVAFRGTYKG